jgi:hypothetical protein
MTMYASANSALSYISRQSSVVSGPPLRCQFYPRSYYFDQPNR